MTDEFLEYPCCLCDYTSLYKSNLKIHFKTKHRVNYSCDECDYKTGDRGDLITHKVRYHESLKPKYINLSNLPKLKPKSIDLLNLPKLEGYNCKKCDFKSSYQSSVYLHMKNKHEGRKFPCDQCQYKATQKGILVKHVKSVHEGVRYQCDKCDHKATQKDHLKKHLRLKHGVIKKKILDDPLHIQGNPQIQ